MMTSIGTIPGDLRDLDQWVCWKNEIRRGELKKVPYQPKGGEAKTDDPATWYPFDEVDAEAHRFDGIGFVFSAEDPFCGIDLDGCRNPQTEEIDQWGIDIIQQLASYTEVSPSKTGVKIFCRGFNPRGRGLNIKLPESRFGIGHAGKKPGIEIYDCGRYFAVTGWALQGYGVVTADQTAIQAAYEFAVSNDPKAKRTGRPIRWASGAADSNAVDRARKYLAKIPPAISGDGGHNQTFHAACVVVNGFDLDEETAFQLLSAWNEACQPPWSERDLRRKISEAAKQPDERGYLLRSSRWGGDATGQEAGGGESHKPEIDIGGPEADVNEAVVAAIGQLGQKSIWLPVHVQETAQVFVRGGHLVGVVPSDDPDAAGTLAVRPLHAAIIRERIGQACDLFSYEEADGKQVPAHRKPPKWMIDAAAERGYYAGKVRPLAGIVQAPTLRRDGSILQTAGYDSATGLLYRPLEKYAVVEADPDLATVQAATERMLGIVADFPWQADADRSAWLALVLTMLGRPSIDGCCPLFAITANVRGAGKSLLVDVASIIAYGRPAARRDYSPDAAELRKTITATAIEATPAVLFDNLAIQLRGSALDAAVTARTWSDRVLGQSRTTGDLPLRTVWVATGNNLAFGSDIARRVLPVRLASPLENPEERGDFQDADLLGSVHRQRAELVVAALTIMRGYFAAGCPATPGGQFGSFEQWSKIIRGAVVWAGLADPLTTRETAKAQDDSGELLALLITGLEEADPDGNGLTVKEIERLVSHRVDDPPTCPALVEAIGLVCGSKFDARGVGNTIRRFAGRTWKSRRITGKTGRSNLKRWAVEEVSPVSLVSLFQPYSKHVSEGESNNRTGREVTNQTHQTNQGVAPRVCPECAGEVTFTPAGTGWGNLDCVACARAYPVPVEGVPQ